MTEPRKIRPAGVVACLVVRGTKMSDTRTPAVVSPVAPVSPSTKINEAAVSYSAWLIERGIDVSPELAQTFWDNENVWRTSPERNAERDSAKAEREASKAKAAKAKADAAKAKLEAERETIAAKAKALGLIG